MAHHRASAIITKTAANRLLVSLALRKCKACPVPDGLFAFVLADLRN